MNRRDFGKAIAASVAVPLIPTPLASAPLVKPIHLMWGEAIARAQNGVTPAYLAKALNVPLDVAHAVQSQLLRKNVIRAGAVRGTTVAVQPTFPKNGYRSVGNSLLDQAKDMARSAIEDQIRQPDPSFAPDAHPDQIDRHNHGSSKPHQPDHTH